MGMNSNRIIRTTAARLLLAAAMVAFCLSPACAATKDVSGMFDHELFKAFGSEGLIVYKRLNGSAPLLSRDLKGEMTDKEREKLFKWLKNSV